jgi:hypothetical protein
LWTTGTFFKQIKIYTTEVQDTDKNSMCQPVTAANIRKEFTVLELSYSIIFPLTINLGARGSVVG